MPLAAYQSERSDPTRQCLVLARQQAARPSIKIKYMCLNPLRLKNPCKNPIKGKDLPYLTVPCGHCTECRMHKNDDWFIRSYFEWLKASELGGFALFFTLTYRDSELPTCTHYHIPCFSHEHIQNWLKRIRNKIDFPIKYLITCEYGDEKHRPHYHGLFYVYKKTDIQSFIKTVLGEWHYGISYTSDTDNGVINDMRGISYCTKYTTKCDIDDDWYGSYLKILRLESNKKSNEPSSELKEFLHTRPFTQTSLDFGTCALDRLPNGDYKYSGISAQSLADGWLILPDCKGVLKKYRLPLYLDRKAHYTTVKCCVSDRYCTKYIPTDYGRSVLAHRYDTYVSAFIYRVNTLCSLSNHFVGPILSSLGYANQTLRSVLHRLSDNLNHNWCLRYLAYTPYIGVNLEDFGFEDIDDSLVLPRDNYLIRNEFTPDTSIDDFNSIDGSTFRDAFEVIYTQSLHYSEDSDLWDFHRIFSAVSEKYSANLLNQRKIEEQKAHELKVLKKRMRRNRRIIQ